MKNKVKVGISNRHVHLTEEVYNKIFDEPISKKCDLNQGGEFASNQMVTIKTEKGEFKNVRVLGPFRSYNQVEISRSDAYSLGLCPPVRKSGDLQNSETITIIGEKGNITLENSCIIANRHVHMNPELAKKLGVVDDEQVKLVVDGDKACILMANIKISDNGYYEVHLDFDDANAAGLKNGDEVEIVI